MAEPALREKWFLTPRTHFPYRFRAAVSPNPSVRASTRLTNVQIPTSLLHQRSRCGSSFRSTRSLEPSATRSRRWKPSTAASLCVIVRAFVLEPLYWKGRHPHCSGMKAKPLAGMPPRTPPIPQRRSPPRWGQVVSRRCGGTVPRQQVGLIEGESWRGEANGRCIWDEAGEFFLSATRGFCDQHHACQQGQVLDTHLRGQAGIQRPFDQFRLGELAPERRNTGSTVRAIAAAWARRFVATKPGIQDDWHRSPLSFRQLDVSRYFVIVKLTFYGRRGWGRAGNRCRRRKRPCQVRLRHGVGQQRQRENRSRSGFGSGRRRACGSRLSILRSSCFASTDTRTPESTTSCKCSKSASPPFSGIFPVRMRFCARWENAGLPVSASGCVRSFRARRGRASVCGGCTVTRGGRGAPRGTRG